MTVQRLECKDCGTVLQERIHFVRGKERYTTCMRHFVLDLCKIGTIKDVAKFVQMSWDTVKDILKAELGCKYSQPDLRGLRYIGIDEFAVAKGHIYMTIVVDLDTERIVYVGEGKGADALDELWPKLKRTGCKIEAVSSDRRARSSTGASLIRCKRTPAQCGAGVRPFPYHKVDERQIGHGQARYIQSRNRREQAQAD